MPHRVTTRFVQPQIDFANESVPHQTFSKYIPVPQELWPIRLYEEGRARPFRDFMDPTPSQMSMIVSAAARGLIEELDPGIHQFVPLILVHKDGAEEPAGAYYLFKIMRVLENGIIDELSDTKHTVIPGASGAWYYSLGQTGSVTFRSSTVNDAAVWCDDKLASAIFFSDALMTRIEAADMKGLRIYGPVYLADAPGKAEGLQHTMSNQEGCAE